MADRRCIPVARRREFVRPLPAAIWAAVVALILVLPPLLWRSDADVLGELACAFVAAMITAIFAPVLAREFR